MKKKKKRRFVHAWIYWQDILVLSALCGSYLFFCFCTNFACAYMCACVYCVPMCVGVHVHTPTHSGQRTVCWSQFSSTSWVLGIEPRSSDSGQVTLTPRPRCLGLNAFCSGLVLHQTRNLIIANLCEAGLKVKIQAFDLWFLRVCAKLPWFLMIR